MADIVERLRGLYSRTGKEAADTIDRQREEIGRLREALEWYGENARLCRLIHNEGDAGRHALADDGGKRARSALSDTTRERSEDAPTPTGDS